MLVRLRRDRGAAIRLASDVEAKDPPREFRLFKAGWNDTTKGKFLLDEEALETVLVAWKDYGNRLSIDFDHAMAADSGASAKDKEAAGWFDLEGRDGELWAVNVEWTGDTGQAVLDKKWGYVSPLFFFDTETRQIVEIVNCALTNTPATKSASPLAAARDRRVSCAASMSFNDITRALYVALPKDGSYICDIFDSTVVVDIDGKLLEYPYSLEGDVVTLGEPTEVVRAYRPKTTEVAATSRAPTNGVAMKAILMMLGLREDATEADALTKISKDAEASKELLSLTGAKNASEALGTVAAWKESHEKRAELVAETSKLSKEVRLAKVEKIVDDKIVEGFLTPAKREYAIALGVKDDEMFQGYLKQHDTKLPVAAAGTSEAKKAPKSTSKLTKQQQALCRQIGVTEEAFLKAQQPDVVEDETGDDDNSTEES